GSWVRQPRAAGARITPVWISGRAKAMPPAKRDRLPLREPVGARGAMALDRATRLKEKSKDMRASHQSQRRVAPHVARLRSGVSPSLTPLTVRFTAALSAAPI